ncbi:MAG: 50S ribosomal protein L11 [Candidatus Nitrosocosmicus sp.]|jgi:large subunit ribosomal protein L11|uniref:50S ribosomal protein L11 n=1 Tax=Candidatus Nitrosocosmicus agrestis TaxID=2563600 RepID=UPI00122E6361|nr:50S ribosomal protein L11 [Candidatus Nitrosocosmicus sp. SS]KAA2280778.1 50S ribosomal protein L11 [Candidatus Nitrosocosmicus sp. SS]KAF0868863.1 50S ribosomal protein L11 [Candidatus Nitrosocosmicus sp. SS]MDR4492170.1 50S ribosomal protein L11 [Candidatus Nitrosocosmicus sp.]HET6589715.1 50S ribosomal protein L11 [Candidatus Nitrosocosmicus sp.]
MGEKKVVNALVSGGEANAGPPLGPALGPLGINILQVVNAINEKTKDFPGMKVPVKVEVDAETKQFVVEVGIPPTAALIFKEAGINKGSGTAGTDFVGNITMESIVKISKMKLDVSYAQTIKSSAKEIVGTCLSLGIKVEDKVAHEVYRDISEGKYDSILS